TRSRVVGSTFTGQTQNREPYHADVRLDVSRPTKHPLPDDGARPARRSAGRERAEVLYSSGSVVTTRKLARKNLALAAPSAIDVKCSWEGSDCLRPDAAHQRPSLRRRGAFYSQSRVVRSRANKS